MVCAVRALDRIDRTECRLRTERLFSSGAVVDGYETVYHEMLAAAGDRKVSA